MPTRTLGFKPVPAYLLSVTIENLRCFGPKQTLDLSDESGRPRQWPIILGDNGTGKTTLLQALATMQPYPSENVKKDGLWDLHWHWDRQSVANKSAKTVSISGTYAIGSLLSQKSADFTSDTAGIEADEDSFRAGSLSSPNWRLALHAYGAARRLGTGPLSKTPLWPDPVLDRVGYDAAIDTLFNPDAALLNAEEWLRDQHSIMLATKAGGTKTKAASQYREAVQVLRGLFPDDDIEDIRCVPIRPGSRTGFMEVQAKTPYGFVPLRQLSLGYQTTTAWILDLAARMFVRYPDSKRPLEENAVVLVDEIDLHLHPRWQRKLFRQLETHFPNVQFVVTAHSPLVVQAAGADANLVVLRRPEKARHVVIDNERTSVQNWRIDQILTSDLFTGVPSAWAPEFDDDYGRQASLLQKRRRTAQEQADLDAIEKRLAARGAIGSPAEQRYLAILREAAQSAQKPRRNQRDTRC